MLNHAVLCHVMLCHAVLCRWLEEHYSGADVMCHAALCHAVLCCAGGLRRRCDGVLLCRRSCLR